MEAAVIIAASILGQILYQNLWLGGVGSVEVAGGIGLIAAFIYLFLARSAELYRLAYILTPERRVGAIVLVWAVGLLMLTGILFLLKSGSDLSRGSFVTFAVLELSFLLGTRFLAAAVINSKISRGTVLGRTAIVIGEANELQQLSADHLLAQFGLKEVSRVALRAIDAGKQRDLLEEAVRLARQLNAEELAVAVGWNQSQLIADINDALRSSPLPVRLLPDSVIRSVLGRRRADVLFNSTMTVELQRSPLTLAERVAKRFLDSVLASIAIVILMPIFLISALAIKFDSAGPVIFRQRRNGFNQQQFGIYKFRTMQVLEDGHQVTQAQRKDPRVTRVGRLLRRASIDELPQLFNVLKGEMSLVGPRPHALAHDDQYKCLIETYCFRHHVKPGITGWAQIHGLRGETEQLVKMQQRVEFDLWYINNWSLWLDIQILLRTCFEVLKHEAY